MSRILAVDTTAADGSIALTENGQLLEEVSLQSTIGFSPVLFGHIQQLLDRHGWPLHTISAFAAASGPGSFTGVRVGLTAVKGLAESLGCPALGVSNLKALAAFGTTTRRAVIIDARRGEVYAAIYDKNLNELSPEIVVPLRDWLARQRSEIDEIVSRDYSAFRSLMYQDVPVTEQRYLAGAVGRIAEGYVMAGTFADPASLDANYVRRSDAELLWREA